MADFLEDECTTAAAASVANARLLRGPRKRKLSAPRPKQTSPSSASALESLPSHLSRTVLRSGGQLEGWLRVLPLSSTPLAVSSAVTDSSLLLHCTDMDALEEVFAAVKSLSVPVFYLTIAFSTGRGGCTNAEQVAAGLATLMQLKALKLTNMNPTDVPTTLTALTRLHIDHSEARSPRAKITTDLSSFPALKVPSPQLR